MIDEEQRKRHATRSLRLVAISLGLFGFLALIVPLFAPLLDGYSFLRFPLGLFLDRARHRSSASSRSSIGRRAGRTGSTAATV